MKLLYIGTASESQEYERIVRESKVKPSVAPQTFETAFLNGVKASGLFQAVNCCIGRKRSKHWNAVFL